MKRLSFFLIGFGFLLLLFFSIFLITFLFLIQKSNSQNNSHVYQYIEISSSNKTKYGIVEMNKPLSDPPFITYRNNKKSVIISPFSQKEFECQGSCFCDEGRRTMTVLSRSLTLLFTSLSTSMALQISKNVFHDECVSKFSDVCTEYRIHTVVRDCDPKEYKSQEEFFRDVMTEYNCRGHCVRNEKLKSFFALERQKEFGDCKRLRISKKLTFFNSEFKRKGKFESIRDRMEDNAIKEFVKKHLTPFCKEMSECEYRVKKGKWMDRIGANKRSTMGSTMSRTGYMCASLNSEGMTDVPNVPEIYTKYWNVHCFV